ncbi:MAG: VanZ family protein [Erysipelotrichaceae bacterium]|nr:VanZ family protein [Erysipelotrichaceae bacterium]
MYEKIKQSFSKRSLFWLITIVLIDIAIFYFSSQQGTASERQSRFVLDVFQIAESLTTQKIIRKLAHFSIYAGMGICWLNFLCSLSLSKKQCFVIAILMCFLFAASDEWHQTFVPGRSGELLDVGLDTLGAMIGTSLMMFLCHLKAMIHQRKDNH